MVHFFLKELFRDGILSDKLLFGVLKGKEYKTSKELTGIIKLHRKKSLVCLTNNGLY